MQLTYTLAMPTPVTHLFHVTLTVTGLEQPTAEFAMPVWTPGSYLVREYARHVQGFAAADGAGQGRPWRKIAKNRWLVETADLTELDVAAVALGAPAAARADALPDVALTGVVSDISPVAREVRGDTTYKVFGAGTKAFWGRLKQTLSLPAGRYRLTTPVWVDCYRWDTTHKRKDYNVEPRQAETMVKARMLDNSIAGTIGHAIEPAISPLGYDWRIGIGLMSAFAAREVFVSTMSILYNVGRDADAENESLLQAVPA